jgi:hypothetical protein
MKAAFSESITMPTALVMPQIDVLTVRKTVHLSLGLIPHDESTNVGNLNVLSNIFKGQYKLPDEVFEGRLYLIYGDQKTIQRLRTIKQRRARATLPVDSLKWALPVPALFHLRMNYLYMISRTHFGESDHASEASLCDAMNFWIRKGISIKKSDFYALEQLVIHSFQARICALIWSKLSGLGLGDDAEDISRILRSYGQEQLDSLIDSIANSYTYHCRATKNVELRNHILFLEHTQTYMLLKHAIRYADIGLIRRAIARSCVYFHASGQHKYAYEMLYMQRLISTDAATPELQRAILANGLVNTRGAPHSWFETDRLVEFHNGTLKTIFRDRRGSSITVEHLLEHCALNTEFFKGMAENLESFLDMRSNSKHPEKSVQTDLLLMAQRLTRSGSITGTMRFPVRHEAVNLFEAAIPRVAGQVLCNFNKKESTRYQYLYTGCFDDEDQEREDCVDDEVDKFFTADPNDM